MGIRKLLLLLGIAFLAGSPFVGSIPVQAAVHAGSDILGLATAPDETGEFSLLDLATDTSFDVHLLVYGFDHPQGIVGWECQIVLPAGVLLTGVSLNGKADPAGVDLETGNIRVFPHISLQAVDGIVHLATLHLVLTDNLEDQDFYLAPYSGPSSASTMSFSLETSESNLFPFNWPGDCQGCSVFNIITSPEPTVSASWDLVKSLYR